MTTTCHECGLTSAGGSRYCAACGTRLFTTDPLGSTQPLDASAAYATRVEAAAPPATTTATQRLDIAARPGLPVGKLLDAKRLVIRQVLQANESGLRFYVAADRANLICPICQHPAGTPTPDACPSCNTVLGAGEWRPQEVLIKESDDPSPLASERAIALADFRHDGLVNVLGAFEEPVYPHAEPTCYVVLEIDHGVPMAGLALPQPEASAVAWASQLAETVAALHKRGFVVGRVQLANVTISGTQARLTNLNRSRRVPDDPAEAKRALDADIDGVADILATLVGDAAVTDRTARLTRQSARPDADPAHPDAAAAELARYLEATYEVIRHPSEVVIAAGGRSDVGQVRPINEDTIAVAQWDHVHQSRAERCGAAVVADGMGGHASGEVASGLAVAGFLRSVAAAGWPVDAPGSGSVHADAVLRRAVTAAAAEVHGERHRTGSDLGTTLVAAAWRGHTVHVAHCGDSRAYVLPADGEMYPLTKDHSLVRELIESGQLDEAAAESYDGRNFITRALGSQADPGFEFAAPVTLAPGDRILLCSDGLTGKVDDSTIARVVRAAPTRLAACDALIRAANAAGGEDNISVLILAAEAAGGA